jgi:hypothetical protein
MCIGYDTSVESERWDERHDEPERNPPMTTTTTQPTAAQLKSALQVMFAVADAVREAGRLPAGPLYAALVGNNVATLDGFESMIRQLVGTGCVRREGDELVWVG